MHIKNVGEYLKKNGIKPSVQRMKIFQYLLDHHTHPTVDDIFQNLSPEMPTLSKTTVYNTLNIFVSSNIIKEIIIEENEVRYDIVTADHGHFKCNCCGALFDVELNIDYSMSPELADCEIDEKHIYFKGICRNCKERSN